MATTLEGAVDVLQLFAEPTRVRLLALLADEELTVAELTAITHLAQSRVSTHLGKLREAGVVRDRRAGSSTYYRMNREAMPESAMRVWELLSAGLRDRVLEQDRSRCAAVLDARKKARFPEAFAGEMERHYSPGRTWEAMARGFLAMLELGDVLDAGAGDGSLAEMLAPRARSLVCLDSSETMVSAARTRLSGLENARVERGDFHAMPFGAASFDQVLLFSALSYATDPAKVLSEVARVLRPNGVVAIVTLDAHEHTAVAESYGHVQPGFPPAALRRMLKRAGLAVELCEVTSRESRPPHFRVVTAAARKPVDEDT
jgi:ArsR family transcriptional regulator